MTRVCRRKYGLTRAATILLATVLNASVAHAQAVVQIGANFTGTAYGDPQTESRIPPDSMGAVGPMHYAELLNTSFAVYSKTGTLQTKLALDGFWNNAFANASVPIPGAPPPPPLTAANNAFDPRILFDRFSQRWYAVAVDGAKSRNSRVLVAVTTGNDPSLPNWRGFAIDTDPMDLRWADFPTVGINNAGLFIAFNSVDIPDFGDEEFAYTSLFGLTKSGLTGGVPQVHLVRAENFAVGINSFQPAVDTDNSPLPLPMISANFSGFPTGMYLPDDFFNGVDLMLEPTYSIMPVAELNPPPDAMQSDGIGFGPLVETGDERFSGNVVLQDGSLWAAQTIQSPTADGRAAIRWFEIDAANFVVKQTGVINNPNLDFFYPSIAVNPFGRVVIGFSASGKGMGGDFSKDGYVASYAAAAHTVSGITVFNAPQFLKQGTGPYARFDMAGQNRWGDYSATTVDPNNPLKFWTIQEWSSGPPVHSQPDYGEWSMQITELLVLPPGSSGVPGTPGGAPLGGEYDSQRPQQYSPDIDLHNIRLREFSDLVAIGDTPENVGDMQTQRFNALLDAVLQVGTDSFTLSGVPAELNLKAALTFIDSDTNVFDTALQLLDVDLSGIQGLPFDAQLHLDPNRPSSGRSVVTELSPRRFAVNSYLDVFTELAIDADRDGVRDQLLVADRSSRLLLAPEPVPGDYNNNGTVDAADFTVWRDYLGQSFTLTNENPAASTPGVVDAEDYAFWKAHFGVTFGSGAGATALVDAAVPEPATLMLLSLLVGWCPHRRRAA